MSLFFWSCEQLFFRTNGKTSRRVLGMGRHAKRLIGMLLLRPRCINCAATTLEYTMHFDPSHTTLFGVLVYVASAKWVNLIYRGKYVRGHRRWNSNEREREGTSEISSRETTRFQVESFPRQSRGRSICIRQFEKLSNLGL